jgi:spore maturation protein CgeB
LVKITILGLTLSSSWGNGHATPYRAILRALHRRGAKVVFYEKDAPYYAAHRDFNQCAFCELKLYSCWDEIRHEALLQVRDSDVVMTASYCPEGAQINEEVLALDGPLHVFYDLDTPITLNALEGGGVEYLRREQMPEFDLYLSFTGGRALERLQHDHGVRLARPLYGCVDPDVYTRVPPRADFGCSLSYLGTYAGDRQQKLDTLFLEPARRRDDLSFVLAGSLYPWEWRWPDNVRRFEHVAPADHPALYSSSRATLNITRKEMAESGFCPSGRFFEAAACGTPIVTDSWQGLDAFFDPDNEVTVVSSAADVMHVLNRPQAELDEMAARARRRTLEEHTGERRAQQLLSYCDEAFGRRRSALEVSA